MIKYVYVKLRKRVRIVKEILKKFFLFDEMFTKNKIKKITEIIKRAYAQ